MSNQTEIGQRSHPSITDLPNTVRAYIEAYNQCDVDGMLDSLAEDVMFQNIVSGVVTDGAIGRKAFAQMARSTIDLFSERQQDVTSAITVASTTVAAIEFRAIPARDLPNGWCAGEAITISGRSLFELENNKISRLIDES